MRAARQLWTAVRVANSFVLEGLPHNMALNPTVGRGRPPGLTPRRWADYLRLSQYPGSRAACATAVTSMLSGNSRKKMTYGNR
jgi:hypothetical protein